GSLIEIVEKRKKKRKRKPTLAKRHKQKLMGFLI
ncbi:hypothetical protein V6N11_021169, partial [Hibiscus sabdariffa]